MDVPDDEDHVGRLLDAMGRYDPSGCYDEVFTEVSEHIGERGEAGKADICVLITWTRGPRARGSGISYSPRTQRSATGQGRRLPPPRISSVSTRLRRSRVSQRKTRWPRWCSPLMIRPSSASLTGVLHGLWVLGCPVTSGRGVTLRYLESPRAS
jgi:hypothetical protein